MRLPESKIKEAILHPEEEVRLTAVSYFADAYSQDESVMPLVIQAVETYGTNTAFRILRDAQRLPQTKATMKWLLDELSSGLDWENVVEDNYGFAIGLILAKADLEQLAESADDILSSPDFPDELKEGLVERLGMEFQEWEEGWAELETLGRVTMERGESTRRELQELRHVVELLARHGESRADFILRLLHRNYRGTDKALMEWLESIVVELAGAMRLEKAIPVLVERLHEDDIGVTDSCITALSQIGGDKVVRGIAEQWPGADEEFRGSATNVLEHIHTDLSVEKCLEFLAVEEDPDMRLSLGHALLSHFADEAIDPVRKLVVGEEDELLPDEWDLRYRLVAACTIMGRSFPDYDAWHKNAVDTNWGWRDYEPGRIRDHFIVDDEEEYDEDEEEWEEEDWDEESEEEFDDDDEDLLSPASEITPLLPFTDERERTRRNDPCPCGSGKKFKKCCLKKQRQQQTTPPKYPIGTVALYGPDDKKTTKIVAAAIVDKDAEPILERWVGTDVQESPKVQQGIKDFFVKHQVQSVVASDRNMGCPHEEGEDFPDGGDCPFCPFWRGKQGSGRRDY